ncbi:MAG: Regulatory protein recX [Frankiales bacterium]|nr:Regulatory protein recX [Frankiales bacterium]
MDDGSAEPGTTPVAAPAPARRRAAGTVGRRTVSQRAPRDLTEDEDAVEVARQVCLDQLSYTARTRAELATALDHRGVPPEAAAQVLDRFTEVGLIDDALFAQTWVTRRSAGKGLSGRALAQELRRRGVDDQTAASALATLDPDDEVAAARSLVDRKLRTTTGLDRDTRVRRLVGMLARKGYGAGLAFRVVRDALTAEGVELAADGGEEE